MKLGTAYETLKDESKRRTYDRIYPQIKSKPAQTKTTPQPAPQTKPKQEEDVSRDNQVPKFFAPRFWAILAATYALSTHPTSASTVPFLLEIF
jgi:curved DNA-binding protein CbpA